MPEPKSFYIRLEVSEVSFYCKASLTNMFTQTRTLAHLLKQTLSIEQGHKNIQTRTHAHTYTHSHALTLTCMHTHTHSRSHVHTLTHTHTHSQYVTFVFQNGGHVSVTESFLWVLFRQCYYTKWSRIKTNGRANFSRSMKRFYLDV